MLSKSGENVEYCGNFVMILNIGSIDAELIIHNKANLGG